MASQAAKLPKPVLKFLEGKYGSELTTYSPRGGYPYAMFGGYPSDPAWIYPLIFQAQAIVCIAAIV